MLQHFPVPIRRLSASLRFPRRATALFVVLACLTFAFAAPKGALQAEGNDPVPVPAQGGSDEGNDWRLVGEWRSIANGDDVRAMARDGDSIWAGSAGGGLMRWRSDGTLERQFLAPQDGLPCNDVRDIVRWRDQWWLATCRGLAYVDEARDRIVGLDTDLNSPLLTSLAVDAEDRLWVGLEQYWDADAQQQGADSAGAWRGGGVAVSADAVAWTTFNKDSGLPSDIVRDVALWRGDIFVATEPHRFFRPQTEGPGEKTLDGNWKREGGGVAQRTASGWVIHNSNSSGKLSDHVTRLAPGADALWAGSWGRGIASFAGAGWTVYRECETESRCIISDYVTALEISDDGAIWVGTARFNGRGTGLNILDARGTPTDDSDDAWYAMHSTNGLPGNRVMAILPDGDASVWFGMSSLDPESRAHGHGLVHLLDDRQTVDVHRMVPSGGSAMTDNDITTMARNPVTGELWVGTARDGIGVRDAKGVWTEHRVANSGGGLASDSIADIVMEPGGIVWVATRQMQYDADAMRWTDGGLSRYDGFSWSKITTDDGLPSNHLSTLALDGRGKLWVGTGATDRGPKEHFFRGSGLAIVNTQTRQWERTFTFPTLTSNNITDIVLRGDEMVVATSYFFYVDPRPRGAQFSTGGGLSVFDLDGETWEKITADEGLSFAVYGNTGSLSKLIDLRSALVDAAGNLWLGGLSIPDGVFTPEVQPDGVVDMLPAGGGAVENHRFTAAGAIRSLAVDREDHVWAASALAGVRIRVEDQWLSQNAVAGGLPSDRLSALVFDGETMWLGTSGDGLIQLSPPENRPGADPTDKQPILRLLPYRVFLPRAVNHPQPRIIQAP